MDEARGPDSAGGQQILIGRRGQAQEAVPLRLEHCPGDLPELDAAPQLAPALGHFHVSRPSTGIERSKPPTPLTAITCWRPALRTQA